MATTWPCILKALLRMNERQVEKKVWKKVEKNIEKKSGKKPKGGKTARGKNRARNLHGTNWAP